MKVTPYESYITEKDPHLVSIQLNLTNHCYCRCKMCHKWQWPNIALDVWPAWQELPELETVVLSGGEPMAYKDLKDLICQIPEHIELGMFTSGIIGLYNHYDELPIHRFGYVRFSIDGASARIWSSVRGVNARAYQTVLMNTMNMLSKFKMLYGEDAGKEHIRVMYTLQNTNIGEFPVILEWCKLHDLPIYGYWVHDNQSLDVKKIQQLQQRLQQYDGYWYEYWTNVLDLANNTELTILDPENCVIPYLHVFIDSDGAVFPCCNLGADNLSYDQRDLRHSYGNLHHDQLMHLVSNGIDRILQYINHNNPICMQCCSTRSRYYRVNLEASTLRKRKKTFL